GFRLAPMKICEKGEMRRDVLRLLAANNRLPQVMEGDLNAMIGACKVGEDRIIRMVEKYGLTKVLEAINHILDYSERRVRAEITNPEGTVVNPIAPAPVGNSTICIGSDIGQATMKALERIVPEKTGSAFIDLTVDTVYGRDSRYDNQMFISFDYSTTPVSSGG